jgi:hypothetical protein
VSLTLQDDWLPTRVGKFQKQIGILSAQHQIPLKFSQQNGNFAVQIGRIWMIFLKIVNCQT